MYSELHICKCGKIHLIEEKDLQEALDSDTSILLICAHCGQGFIIGGDKTITDDGDPAFDMYSIDFGLYNNEVITPDSFGKNSKYKIGKILYNHGIKVPMMTGEYADTYYYDKFYDSSAPMFSEIQKKNITLENVMNFINKYERDRQIVDMTRFINENSSDSLEFISHYLLSAFDWKGTKYEWKPSKYKDD